MKAKQRKIVILRSKCFLLIRFFIFGEKIVVQVSYILKEKSTNTAVFVSNATFVPFTTFAIFLKWGYP